MRSNSARLRASGSAVRREIDELRVDVVRGTAVPIRLARLGSLGLLMVGFLGKDAVSAQFIPVAQLGHGPTPGHGSTFPGFMMPSGSSAALIRRITASSAPPRQSGIM